MEQKSLRYVLELLLCYTIVLRVVGTTSAGRRAKTGNGNVYTGGMCLYTITITDAITITSISASGHEGKEM